MLRSTILLALMLACQAAVSMPAVADVIVHLDAGMPVRTVGPAPADAYVEARLRPAGANGGLYVVGRWQDERNWYGAGLRFDPAVARMQVEIVCMRDGVLTRLKQFGRAAPPDARFDTVRLEMSGEMLTAYLNGERITSVVDTALPLPGRYGIVAIGGAFDASQPVTGPAADKPARLALARAPHRIVLSVGDTPLVLPISALGPFRLPTEAPPPAGRFMPQPTPQDAAAAARGAPSLPVMASAADAALIQVAVGTDADGGNVKANASIVLTPLAAGTTTVTLATRADPNVQAVLDVHVNPASPPRGGATPDQVRAAVVPRSGARDVPFDTPLRLRLDGPAALGASGGAVRVVRRRDGVQVDAVRVDGDYDLLGSAGQPFRRAVRRQPVAIEGNDIIVHLHGGVLQTDEDYLVTVDDGVFAGALGGRPFTGIGAAQGWTFRTRAALHGNRIVVDDDGPADFRTVQGALDYAMATPRALPVTIDIRDGRYQELLYLRGKDNVTLRGQSRDGVVIEARNSDGINPGSGMGQAAGAPGVGGGRALFLVEDADMLTLDTLTIRNSTQRDAPAGGQAEALFFGSEGRLVARNASFYSEQDTVQVRGYAWFYRTLVAGNVDFIWGNNRAALFEESEVRTLGGGKGKGGGYVLQARTVDAHDKGFLFVRSRLTAGPGRDGDTVAPGSTWLARSAGYATAWDNIAFIDCRMGPHIAPSGWATAAVRQPAPNPPQASVAAGWREAGTLDLDGRSLDLRQRSGGRVLTADEARAAYSTRAAFFAGFDGGRGWNPMP